jgi:DNA-binding GntR family transcriptional regulator
MAVKNRRPPVNRTSLSDGVYEELLARLFDNTLPPGAPMNMDALARDLKVSQTPIREALVRLETTGLVNRAALRGYRAAPMLSAKELDDLMHARCVIEPATTRLAAERVSEDFLAELDLSIEHLSTSSTGPSFTEYHDYWKADERFHDLIAQQADNAFLYRAFESLGGQAQRFRMFGRLGVSDADLAIAEHKTIREALASGDPAHAEASMLAHVTAVRARSAANAGR